MIKLQEVLNTTKYHVLPSFAPGCRNLTSCQNSEKRQDKRHRTSHKMFKSPSQYLWTSELQYSCFPVADIWLHHRLYKLSQNSFSVFFSLKAVISWDSLYITKIIHLTKIIGIFECPAFVLWNVPSFSGVGVLITHTHTHTHTHTRF